MIIYLEINSREALTINLNFARAETVDELNRWQISPSLQYEDCQQHNVVILETEVAQPEPFLHEYREFRRLRLNIKQVSEQLSVLSCLTTADSDIAEHVQWDESGSNERYRRIGVCRNASPRSAVL